MGGFGGQVRAKTSDEARTKFEKEVPREVQKRVWLSPVAPLDREAALIAMRQDLKTDGWVLDYYFSK
jgi:hypothetical protein